MKKTMLRRGLAWLLVLVMALSAVPFGVFAEEAPQGEGASQEENGNPPVCTCAEQAKCTVENVNAACPVCSTVGTDLDKCCLGKTQEQLDAEAAAKKAAEEEAAKKAAEEEAAKKAAEEEAAKKASEEAVKAVQEKIDALPAAEDITAENRDTVASNLEEIKQAMDQLTEEERNQLKLEKYTAAAEALKGIPGDAGKDTPDGPSAPYTVTFDSNGGTACDPAQTDADGKLTRLPEPTKEGCVFRGWKDGDDIVSESTVFDKDTTLTALWTPVQTYNCMMELEPLTKEQFDLWVNGAGHDPNAYNPDDRVEVYGAPRAPKEEQETKAKEVLNSENVWLIGFDIGVTLKIGETIPVTDTQKTIRLIMPMKCVDFGDKLTILRTHDGKITEIPRGKPQADTEEGWYLDDEGKIHLAVRYFSDYAVAYVPYTVSFDSKGGSSCQPVTTRIDGTLENLPISTRTGYTFDGWYVKNADGTEAKVEERVTVFTADATVYAKWSPVTYTVTFHANYGDTDTTAAQTFTYDAPQALNCGTGIAREYYRISGWAESAQGAKKYEANETVKNLGAVTEDGFRGKDLYALWEYVPVSVTFDARGVDGDGNVTQGTVTENGQKKDTVERKTQETPINTLRSLPVPDAQQDYEFVGWYYKDKDDRNKEKPVIIGSTVFTEPTTVYAKWKRFEPVTVTLKCQKGTMTLGGKTVSEGTMQTKWPGVLDGTLPTPARTGYKFQGWYTAAGLKADEDTVFLKDTTLYARWISAVSRSGNPKTGDQVRLGLALGILAVAAAGLTVAIVARKRKK